MFGFGGEKLPFRNEKHGKELELFSTSWHYNFIPEQHNILTWNVTSSIEPNISQASHQSVSNLHL
jgi:hypothetical protein